MKCVLCQKTSFKTIVQDIQNPRNIGENKYNYIECKNCKLWLLDPYPTREIISQIYNKDYNLYQDKESIAAKIMTMIASNREKITQQFIPASATILDVGCGNGNFLLSMKKKGYTVYGTEWNEYIANKAKLKVGENNIHIGDIKDIPFKKPIQSITLFHVLEHNIDPLHLLNEINNLIDQNGWIIIEVPNSYSKVLQLTKQNYPWFSIPEHVTYWNIESLTYLAKMTGYKIVRSSTPFSMPLLYAKAKKDMKKAITSAILQYKSAKKQEGDIIRQVWKKSQ